MVWIGPEGPSADAAVQAAPLGSRMTIDLQAQARRLEVQRTNPVPAGAQVWREETLAAGIEGDRQQMGFHRGDRREIDRVNGGVVIAVGRRRCVSQRGVGGCKLVAAGMAVGRCGRAMVGAFAGTAAGGERGARHHLAGERGPGLSRKAQQDHDRRDELPDAHGI